VPGFLGTGSLTLPAKVVITQQPFAAMAETHSAVVYFAGDRA